MSTLIRILRWLHAQSLNLYPKDFRADFGAEMQSVFTEAITQKASPQPVFFIFLRELRDLPGALFELYTANWLRGGPPAMENEDFSPSTRREAFIGALPFLAFGAVSMIGKLYQVPYLVVIPDLVFYLFALVGMLIGWKRKFPLWSYAYLGWSLVFTWWWSTMHLGRIYVGYFILIAFATAVLIGILWTRSFDPITKLLSDLSQDLSPLSLAMYTFVAFVFLIYDENHHPYLLLYMAATTAVLAAGAWFFMRSATLWGRALSVWGGLITSFVINQICENTWDAAAFYGRPLGSPDPWHMTAFRTFTILSFISGILLWPVAIEVLRRWGSKPHLGKPSA